MAKRLPKIIAGDTQGTPKPQAVEPITQTEPVQPGTTGATEAASRFSSSVTRYLAEYERLHHDRQIALEHSQVVEALVLLLQQEHVEDQIRSAFNRGTFWSA